MTKPKLKTFEEYRDLIRLQLGKDGFIQCGPSAEWLVAVEHTLKSHHAYLLHLEERIEELEKTIKHPLITVPVSNKFYESAKGVVDKINKRTKCLRCGIAYENRKRCLCGEYKINHKWSKYKVAPGDPRPNNGGADGVYE